MLMYWAFEPNAFIDHISNCKCKIQLNCLVVNKMYLCDIKYLLNVWLIYKILMNTVTNGVRFIFSASFVVSSFSYLPTSKWSLLIHSVLSSGRNWFFYRTELAVSVVVVGSNRHCHCDTILLQSQKIIINLKSKDIEINANESKAMIRKKKEIFNIHFLQFCGKMLPSRSPS